MAADALNVLTGIDRFSDYFLMTGIAPQVIEKPRILIVPGCIAGGLDELSGRS
jgi:hypothetical protein